MAKKVKKEDKLIVDFGGQVMYEAFRKIVDYLYLNDLTVLSGIADSTELLEIIKLSKLYKLDALFKAAESHFQEVMFAWFETSSHLSLKMSPANSTDKAGTVKRGNNKNAKEGSGEVGTGLQSR